jgi:hypothetical protein
LGDITPDLRIIKWGIHRKKISPSGLTLIYHNKYSLITDAIQQSRVQARNYVTKKVWKVNIYIELLECKHDEWIDRQYGNLTVLKILFFILLTTYKLRYNLVLGGNSRHIFWGFVRSHPWRCLLAIHTSRCDFHLLVITLLKDTFIKGVF